MSTPDPAALGLVPTGVANVASVRAAFGRLGVELALLTTPEQVAQHPAVVLPGVGAFEPAVREWRRRGFDEAVVERVVADRPTLAICLGLQLLFEASEEGSLPGLGVLPGVVRRFPEGSRCPHMGWNSMTCGKQPRTRFLEDGDVYFVHSYACFDAPPDDAVATAEHGGRSFVAGVERGSLLACQFHPELSGAEGRSLLQNWWRAARARSVEAGSC